ncbi:hypothetical protein FB566_1842 [Stackebrandtia endophytica]|uniref:DUF378 domain-containing protein n=1 Tax=Stackebrandtia endophytica TaxID=1496996 RepID=A0A543AUQ4_9ACTN|nr:DUF378 domain-containing protein [Stackebrandtia endophytica]TQL76316.1 hypothetical protein FB566_1842 [Stackebrandtia endophytica]
MRVILGIATALVIIGGLNWGLVGAFDFNLVDTIFGAGSVLSRIIYILVGVSAIVALGNFAAMRGKPAQRSHTPTHR